MYVFNDRKSIGRISSERWMQKCKWFLYRNKKQNRKFRFIVTWWVAFTLWHSARQCARWVCGYECCLLSRNFSFLVLPNEDLSKHKSKVSSCEILQSHDHRGKVFKANFGQADAPSHPRSKQNKTKTVIWNLGSYLSLICKCEIFKLSAELSTNSPLPALHASFSTRSTLCFVPLSLPIPFLVGRCTMLFPFRDFPLH